MRWKDVSTKIAQGMYVHSCPLMSVVFIINSASTVITLVMMLFAGMWSAVVSWLFMGTGRDR